jgi:hypothetical protein
VSEWEEVPGALMPPRRKFYRGRALTGVRYLIGDKKWALGGDNNKGNWHS